MVKTINSLRIWAVRGQITVNLGLIHIMGISPQCSMSYCENHTKSQVVSSSLTTLHPSLILCRGLYLPEGTGRVGGDGGRGVSRPYLSRGLDPCSEANTAT